MHPPVLGPANRHPASNTITAYTAGITTTNGLHSDILYEGDIPGEGFEDLEATLVSSYTAV